jgi:two-component system, chemotaxis family, sensor kinase Cph1
MFSAEGLVLIVERKVYSFGTVPKKNHIDDLAIWVQSNNIDSLYHQSSLTTVFEPALDYVTIASGIVVLPLHTGKNDYAIAFRPEAVTKANWGGNPNEAVQFEPDGKNYHPRSSFALWQQTVHNTAIPWQEQELKAMEIFVSFLRPFLYQKNLLLNN